MNQLLLSLIYIFVYNCPDSLVLNSDRNGSSGGKVWVWPQQCVDKKFSLAVHMFDNLVVLLNTKQHPGRPIKKTRENMDMGGVRQTYIESYQSWQMDYLELAWQLFHVLVIARAGQSSSSNGMNSCWRRCWVMARADRFGCKEANPKPGKSHI